MFSENSRFVPLMSSDPPNSSRFHPGHRAKVSIQPAYRAPGWKTKNLEARRDLGNRASPVNQANVKRPRVTQHSPGQRVHLR